MHANRTLDLSQRSWQYIALAAKKYFFIISGAESAYGDDSLHKQIYCWITSIKGSLPKRKPKFEDT